MVAPPFPSALLLEPALRHWLQEDLGRGDRTTEALLVTAARPLAQARWIAKQAGVIAGLPLVASVFQLLDPNCQVEEHAAEGDWCPAGTTLLTLTGPPAALLTGERVALNLVMHLSGIATLTRQYVEQIAGFSTQLVDTRKTTPGLRILEKYATQVGGARNHRWGLDDAIMIKDNHIQAAGGITSAVTQVRARSPYPLRIEVETANLAEVAEALHNQVDIIMLDNMSVEMMQTAVQQIRAAQPRTQIEASGNITLETISAIAATGVDFISSSAPITRSSWLDISMQLQLSTD